MIEPDTFYDNDKLLIPDKDPCVGLDCKDGFEFVADTDTRYGYKVLFLSFVTVIGLVFTYLAL